MSYSNYDMGIRQLIDDYNGLTDPTKRLNEYFEDLLNDDVEVTVNDRDEDIKLQILTGSLSEDSLRSLQKEFVITFIDKDGIHLYIDLRLKDG